MVRLKREAERAKRVLSSIHQTQIKIENFYHDEDFDETLTRSRFDEINLNLFRKTLDPIKQVLKDSHLSKDEIDEVVLVGGSTRIPKIQQLIADFFNGKQIFKSINPDEAIAYGAAVQGGIISNVEGLTGTTVIDVTPLTLGIETFGGIMTGIIPRTSKIPVRKTQTFTNSHDNQDVVEIQVFEGDRAMTRDCHLLGTFELLDVIPKSRGQNKIDVTFEIDQNGLLVVSAEERESGIVNKIVIDKKNNQLTEEEIDRMSSDAKKYSLEDKNIQKLVQIGIEFSHYIDKVKSLIEENQNKFADKTVEEFHQSIEETRQWLLENSDEEYDQILQKFRDTQKLFLPLFQSRKVEEDNSLDFPEFKDAL